MSNFASYQSYVPQEEEIYIAPTIRAESPVHRVGFIDGQVLASTEQSSDKGHTGQLNPFHGTDTWQATARTTTGMPAQEITKDTLVTINGLQGTVGFWVKEGYLQQGADGEFTEGTGPKEVPEEIQGEHLPINAQAMEVINAALEPLPQHALDGLAAHAIGTALGKFDEASLTQKFSAASGRDIGESHQRMDTIKQMYQAHADHAISIHAGIGADDRADFWDYCRANHGQQLQDAIGRQLHGQDVAGYLALARRWQSETAPSLAALSAAGIPTRNGAQGPECQIGGNWMSTAAAARAGLI